MVGGRGVVRPRLGRRTPPCEVLLGYAVSQVFARGLTFYDA